jgi:hypothetical protein
MEELRKGVASLTSPRKALVVAGMGPALTYRNAGLILVKYTEISPNLDGAGLTSPLNIYRVANTNIFLIYALSRDNVTLLQREGYSVYMLSDSAPSVTAGRYGYDGFKIGMQRLVSSGDRAFYKTGATELAGQ